MMAEHRFPVRKNVRLSAQSYKQHAAYFVTVCTHEKQCLLSTVAGQSVQQSEPGELV
jgi:hypothetical protein